MPVIGSSPQSSQLAAEDVAVRHPETASPAPSSTPYASCSWPVPASTGTSSRPTTPERTAADRGVRQRRGQQREQRPRRDDGGADRRGEGRDHQRRVEHAGAPVAEHDGERALAGVDVGRDVAQVVRHEDRAGQRAAADAAGERRPGEPLGLDVRRAEHGDQAEEDEDRHLAEAAVAVRLARAGVAPGRGDRDRADDAAATTTPAPTARGRRAAATAKQASAAPRPAAGAATPEPTSRSGPTRCSSVPRTPSL